MCTYVQEIKIILNRERERKRERVRVRKKERYKRDMNSVPIRDSFYAHVRQYGVIKVSYIIKKGHRYPAI